MTAPIREPIALDAVALAGDALRALRDTLPQVLSAAIVPYFAAVGVMVIGCPLGIPGRFPFDLTHVALEVAFVTAVARTTSGSGPGPRIAGVALPRFAWPGGGEVLRITGAAVILLIPAAALVMAYMAATAAWIAAQDAIALTVISRITPAFMLSALLGAVVGAGQRRQNAVKPPHADRRENLRDQHRRSL